MNISIFTDHVRAKRSPIQPFFILLTAALILSGCAGQTATPTPVVSTLTVPESQTAASSLPTVESSATPGVEPTAASTTLQDVSCTAPATLTPSSTEGPYFTAGSPERASLLEAGMPGTVLVLSGFVLTSDCQPVANVKLDFWQADANGVYDNQGFTLRGHQFTDEKGFYQLTTVIPGEYPGRTEHIHFKVISPGGTELTSQLYFPGVGANEGDQIFKPELLIDILEEGDTVTGDFNFVITP
jgi:protocatechuate 3,4-dioxygenase beta subunit